MEPVHRLALNVLWMSALTVLAFFFHLIAFLTVLAFLAMALAKFKFVYENTRIPHDPDFTAHPVTIIRHEDYAGPELPDPSTWKQH